ncbi:MAG: hypothetical protein ACXW0T_02535 [Methylobacter sp.]
MDMYAEVILPSCHVSLMDFKFLLFFLVGFGLCSTRYRYIPVSSYPTHVAL